MSRVSVIVPVYRCLPYVEGCLRSVLDQTRPVDEIVLVDDRGGDESMDVAQRYLRDRGVPFRSIVHDHNRGLGRARNSGLAASTGDLVWFLDSDDEADFRFVESLTTALESGAADFACTRTERVDEHGRVLQIDEASYPADVVSGIDFAHLLITGHAKAYACTKLFRRAALGDRPWDEGRAYEDMAPSMRMALAARRVALVNTPLYRYLYREGSISTSLNRRTLDLFAVERDVRAAVAAAGLTARWRQELLGFRYREILRSVAHVAMRADHASDVRPDLYGEVIARVRSEVAVRDVIPLLRTGNSREAAFAALMSAAPGLYSTVLRYR